MIRRPPVRCARLILASSSGISPLPDSRICSPPTRSWIWLGFHHSHNGIETSFTVTSWRFSPRAERISSSAFSIAALWRAGYAVLFSFVSGLKFNVMRQLTDRTQINFVVMKFKVPIFNRGKGFLLIQLFRCIFNVSKTILNALFSKAFTLCIEKKSRTHNSSLARCGLLCFV